MWSRGRDTYVRSDGVQGALRQVDAEDLYGHKAAPMDRGLPARSPFKIRSCLREFVVCTVPCETPLIARRLSLYQALATPSTFQDRSSAGVSSSGKLRK